MTQINGWHVFGIFAACFGVIIGVNMILAVNAVRTFPGLEVRNSYVASQTFDEDRRAQLGLGWDVSATLLNDQLIVRFQQGSVTIAPEIVSAVFGRATHIGQDQHLEFEYDGQVFRATVAAGSGNWNLRLKARSPGGVLFQQRLIVQVLQ